MPKCKRTACNNEVPKRLHGKGMQKLYCSKYCWYYHTHIHPCVQCKKPCYGKRCMECVSIAHHKHHYSPKNLKALSTDVIRLGKEIYDEMNHQEKVIMSGRHQ